MHRPVGAQHRRVMASGGGGRREPVLASGLAAAARMSRSAGRRGPARRRIAWRGRVPRRNWARTRRWRRGLAGGRPGPPVVEPVQQPGDRLGVAEVAERGVDMIQQARPQAARIGGLPGERVGSWPGEPPPGRGDEGRVDPPGRRRWHWRPPAGLGQGGRDQGAGQPGQQHRGARRRGRRRQHGPLPSGNAGTAAPRSRCPAHRARHPAR